VVQGSGSLDRVVILRGALDKVNVLLTAGNVLYTCRTMDGCVPSYHDTVTVYVNDEGFQGKGGPLSVTSTFNVTVIS
jgi:hypothetical protein